MNVHWNVSMPRRGVHARMRRNTLFPSHKAVWHSISGEVPPPKPKNDLTSWSLTSSFKDCIHFTLWKDQSIYSEKFYPPGTWCQAGHWEECLTMNIYKWKKHCQRFCPNRTTVPQQMHGPWSDYSLDQKTLSIHFGRNNTGAHKRQISSKTS